VLVVLPALVAVLLAACGGSSGVDTQTPTSDPSSSSTSTSPTPSTSVTTSTAAPSFSASAIPTPTVTAPAQDAVNAYIALANAYNRASVEPAHADLATINKYLSGKALTLFDQSLSSMKSAGQAYRGTPADPQQPHSCANGDRQSESRGQRLSGDRDNGDACSTGVCLDHVPAPVGS
jgi:hypothetical protein